MNHSKPFKLAILPFMISALSGCGDDNLDPEQIPLPEAYVFADSLGNNTVEVEEIITLKLLIRELDQLIASDYLEENGQALGMQATQNLLKRAYLLGTKGDATSLSNADLYATDSVTPITAYNIQGQSYLELTSNINIQDSIPGISGPLHNRKLPYGAEEELTPEDEKIGDFIGWDFNSEPDGDKIPNAHVLNWLERIGTLYSDSDPDTNYISESKNYRLLVRQFLEVSVPYFVLTNQILIPENFEDSNSVDLSNLEDLWDTAHAYLGLPTHGKNHDYSNLENTASLDANNIDELRSSIPTGVALDSLFATYDSPLSTKHYFNTLNEKFLQGRVLLSSEELDFTIDERLSRVYQLRREIMALTEEITVATLIAHMNNFIIAGDTVFATDEISETYINHWSKLKAYALALQFNPHTQLSYDDIKSIHSSIGLTPPSKNSVRRVQTSLLSTRATLREIFNLSSEDVKNWGKSWSSITY